MAERYLTSKELLEITGISRATLNNYINQGLLPRPVIAPSDGQISDAPRIGHFPESALQMIARIDELKRGGLKMAKIAEMIAEHPARKPAGARSSLPRVPESALPASGSAVLPSSAASYSTIRLDGPLRLTIEDLDHPAYMVNRQFELEWCNDQAAAQIFDNREMDSAVQADDPNLFGLLVDSGLPQRVDGWNELVRFHLAIAKNFLTHEQLLSAVRGEDRQLVSQILHEFDDVGVAVAEGGVLGTEINFARANEPTRWYKLYASFFREGIFFTYAPLTEDQDSILTLLARRDLVIRDLLKKRRPHLTPLSVLVADLQGSCKICAELPPEEYFELINEIWSTMEPLLRSYYATHGKHVGDGMLYYFLPQPDSSYVLNAMRCAIEMRDQMRRICDTWTRRKNWVNRLRLNIGIDEGKEWFGTYQTPTHVEFTALGDTINNAARLSDFASDGTIWVTKNVLGTLPSSEREKLTFGVRRRGADSEEILVRSTFARIGNLAEMRGLRDEKFRDVSALPVTEILEYRAH